MFLSDALKYAKQYGWQVFPIKPRQKLPATRRGFYDATNNPSALCRWFGHHPFNVGIRTGLASGVFVLDIDGDDGAASLRELEARHGTLPITLRSTTARGSHYWYRLDAPLPCSSSRVGSGIDIKADFGYVLAAPSVHPSGVSYQWLDENASIARAPQWLIDLAQRPVAPIRISTAKPTIRRTAPADIYGRSALNSEIRELSKIGQGGRNNALNCAAFKLAQLVAGGELDHDEVEHALQYACTRNGLAHDDGWHSVNATIRSGMHAGMKYPRSRRRKCS